MPITYQERFELRLYVNGATVQARTAERNLRALLEKHLPDFYDLIVIDVHEAGDEIESLQILATPTLIKLRPGAPSRVIGDMSDAMAVAFGIGLELSA